MQLEKALGARVWGKEAQRQLSFAYDRLITGVWTAFAARAGTCRREGRHRGGCLANGVAVHRTFQGSPGQPWNAQDSEFTIRRQTDAIWVHTVQCSLPEDAFCIDSRGRANVKVLNGVGP